MPNLKNCQSYTLIQQEQNRNCDMRIVSNKRKSDLKF